VYLERRILASIHKNDAYFDFSAIIGWKHLGACFPLIFCFFPANRGTVARGGH
jgi:hypothetical protein